MGTNVKETMTAHATGLPWGGVFAEHPTLFEAVPTLAGGPLKAGWAADKPLRVIRS